MSDLYYCRVPLPDTDGSDAQRKRAIDLAWDHAVGTVKYELKRAGIDAELGNITVSMDMDSTFERESVIAEWRVKSEQS